MDRVRALALVALLLVPLRAQEVLAVLEPTGQDQDLAATVAFVGDQDGDGVSEVAVAEHFADRVTVYDGAFGDVRHVLSFGAGDGFDSDAAGGELDGDGLADIAAGTWSIGIVRLISGLDGHQIKAFAKISRVLDVIGDIDGDGLDDVAAADHGFDTVDVSVGLVRVFSSGTGTSYYARFGAVDGDDLGACVVGAGDLDGDGVPDVAYAAPGTGPGPPLSVDFGAVHAGSVDTGQLLWTVPGDTAMGALGSSIAAAGDVDLDGVPDVIAGAGGGFASVRVLSGATGALISESPAPALSEGYATSVA